MDVIAAQLAAQLAAPQRRGDGIIIGHSYTRKQGTQGTWNEPALQDRLATLLKCRVFNYGKGAVPVHDPASGFGYVLEHFCVPRYAAPDLPRFSWALLLQGINDLVYIADGSAWRNYTRLEASLVRSSRGFAYDNAAIAYSGSGTWNTTSPSAGAWGSWFKGTFVGGPFKTNTSTGSIVTFTVPSDYDGCGCASFLLPVTPTDSYSGTITVTRGGNTYNARCTDGQTNGTFQAAGWTNESNYNGVFCKRIVGAVSHGPLQAGDVITLTCTTISSGAFRFNAALIEASTVPDVVVANVAKIPGYSAQGAHPYPENDTRVDLWNTQVAPVCAEFEDGHVIGYDMNGDLNADPALFETGSFARHPNGAGYAKIAAGVVRSLPRRSVADQANLASGSSFGDLMFAPSAGTANISTASGSTAAPWARITSDGFVKLGGIVKVNADLAAGQSLFLFVNGAGQLPLYSAVFNVFDDSGRLVQLRIDGCLGIPAGGGILGRLQILNGVANGALISLDGIQWPSER